MDWKRSFDVVMVDKSNTRRSRYVASLATEDVQTLSTPMMWRIMDVLLNVSSKILLDKDSLALLARERIVDQYDWIGSGPTKMKGRWAWISMLTS